MEDQCLKEHNAFFKLSLESPHILQRHDVRHINSITFLHLPNRKAIQAGDYKAEVSALHNVANSTIKKMISYLQHNNLFQKDLRLAERESQRWYDLNA
jgi:hypothetical protein